MLISKTLKKIFHLLDNLPILVGLYVINDWVPYKFLLLPYLDVTQVMELLPNSVAKAFTVGAIFIASGRVPNIERIFIVVSLRLRPISFF